MIRGLWIPLLALACAAPAPPAQSPVQEQAPLAERAARILSRAIRLRTVNPPGDELPLAAYFVRLLREAGLEAAVVPAPDGESKVGRASAWGVLPGRQRGHPLVLLSHLDVVPAEADEWRVDPFAGVVRDGQVYGRGAQDAKGVAVVQLLALTELARSGKRLERDIVFLATPDEETGGLDGAGRLVRERRELLLGARYLLTEGGGVLVGPTGRPAWHIAVTEKSPCWLELIAEGPAGHSSAPPGNEAVPRLVAALERVRQLRTPIRVVPQVARMFRALAPLAAPEDTLGFANLGRQLATDASFRERFLAQSTYGALVRDTISMTVLHGSPRTNVLAPRASAHLDARLLPGGRCDEFAQQIRRVVGDPSVRVEILLSFPSRSSPLDTPLYRAIGAVAHSEEPDAAVVPHVVAGFTDAHYFRELGIEAYGFVPRWHRLGERRGVHGPNERISVENLERGVRTLIAILRELDVQEDR